MILFLSFNDGSCYEYDVYDCYFKHDILHFVPTNDDRVHSIELSNLHYFSISGRSL